MPGLIFYCNNRICFYNFTIHQFAINHKLIMHIVIAPNAFKNCLDASSVAIAIEKGLVRSKLACTTTCFPVADGGDGTAELITQLCNGSMMEASTTNPFGLPISSSFGLIDHGKTAVIEMASASGIRLLQTHELNPLKASSFGTGELIKAALDLGVKRIILGVGGSATVDGGAGILKALGVKFFDNQGNILSALPETFSQLATIDSSMLDPRLKNCTVIVLCDVSNPLLGTQGSAAVFGPQKGASPTQVIQLEQGLEQLANIILHSTGKRIHTLAHGGAAGGVAAGLHAYIAAQIVNGIHAFLQITGFKNVLENAQLIITGEGSLDMQTLDGKAPFGVAVEAANNNIPVVALAGKISQKDLPFLHQYFDVLLSINSDLTDLSTAMTNTADNLTHTAFELGNLLHIAFNK